MINRITEKVEKFQSLIGKSVSWLALLLVLVVCYDVFTRYLLNQSSVALQELEWHIFAALFLLSAAYTLSVDEHVRIDLFFNNVSKRKQALINLLGTILFLIPFCITMIIVSYNFFESSFLIKESSPDGGGLPARYILKAVLPITFLLLFLQSFVIIYKSILTIRDKKEND